MLIPENYSSLVFYSNTSPNYFVNVYKFLLGLCECFSSQAPYVGGPQGSLLDIFYSQCTQCSWMTKLHDIFNYHLPSNR